MKEAALIFILVNVVLAEGDEKKHVHFKVHTPEIIKHHIHTKTIFIHIYPPPKIKDPKEKKKYYDESNVEDYSAWNTYENYGNTGNQEIIEGNKHNLYNNPGNNDNIGVNNYNQDLQNSYYPLTYANANTYGGSQLKNGVFIDNTKYVDYDPANNYANGYSEYNAEQDQIDGRNPIQYAIHEDINDIPNNVIDNYEKGYTRGSASETGHFVTKNLKDFYRNEEDEADEFNEGEHLNEYDDNAHQYQRGYHQEINHRDRVGREGLRRRFHTLRIPRIILKKV